ncbi:MAG: riboflavin synthase [Proteobacteria bacterium]|nr:riboflavin synthase [Pseudomonadota bacterium]
MFTGIIEDIGSISDIRKSGGKWEFCIKTVFGDQGIHEGDSIAIDGVCLTATSLKKDMFYADASLETLSLTTLKDKKTGSRVNIERAMASDGRFGGHFVMGHVDGIGTITNISKEGDSIRLEVEIPSDLSRYIVRKGSVAINGISLTVNEQRGNIFSVNIIPFTVSKTTIGEINVHNKVNIETDIIGKYIESFVDKVSKKGITMNFLYEQGFIKGE